MTIVILYKFFLIGAINNANSQTYYVNKNEAERDAKAQLNDYWQDFRITEHKSLFDGEDYFILEGIKDIRP